MSPQHPGVQHPGVQRPGLQHPGPRRPRLVDPDRRLRVVVLAVLMVLSLFVGRLLQLQGLDASALAAEALGERMREVTLHAQRGDILAADGVVLATSVERRTVTVDQKLVPEYTRTVDGQERTVGVEGAAQDLAPLLGMDVAKVRQALGGGKAPQDLAPYAIVAKDVPPHVWRDIQALRIPGVFSEVTSQRVYPAGEVAGNLVGFVGGDGVPLAGLEMTRDEVLAGRDGMRSYEVGGKGQMIPTGERAEVDPVRGSDVLLTINRDLQWYAQQAIAEAVEAADGEWGTVTVTNPETGEILALAEAPTVDPNEPGKAAAEDRGTRALSGVIEPGSTSKVITAAAAIEEGIVTPLTRFQVPDRYTTENGQSFKDSHPHPVQKRTFAGILAESSNTGTVMVGEQLSRAERYEYLTRFGLGQPTGLGFPGETRGILAQPEDWDGRQQYTVLFGQGLSVNALQSAQVFATIANDGVAVSPKLVTGVRGPDGHLEPTPAPTTRQVVSAETAQAVRTMLESAVSEGTGANAKIPGYRVAGKTGTAQAPADGGYEGYTGSFIGMAPAEDPKLVVSVTVQRPKNGYYGGTVAAPVFQKVMSYALQAYKIPPSGEPATLYPISYE